MNRNHHFPSTDIRAASSACRLVGLTALVLLCACPAAPVAEAALEVGLAVRDVTPTGPVWLAGYASRTHPSERVDTPLLVQACAFRSGDERVVFVSVDNCEVSGKFTEPVLRELNARHGFKPGAVAIVSSHTHSAPVVEGPLSLMYPLSDTNSEPLLRYDEQLKRALVEVVTAALADLKPARLEHGVGRATFAINRREFRDNGVAIGVNPDGPVDWEVPVLKVLGDKDTVRAILYGYACHPTSLSGDDFYVVSGDYVAYARQHLEACYPGTMAIFLAGMGADSNPFPRGRLLDAKRHGLQLAGAVTAVLNRPMRPVQGPVRLAYEEVALPLETPPSEAKLKEDAQGKDTHIRKRAAAYLARLEAGKLVPTTVKLPMAAVRLGDDLTFVTVSGEVVVDYALRLKRELTGDHPWTVGYAYEVPCYIPSIRVIREGGYEAESSLTFYGVYGPFKQSIENLICARMKGLVAGLRSANASAGASE